MTVKAKIFSLLSISPDDYFETGILIILLYTIHDRC